MAIRKSKIEFEIGETINISRKGECTVAGECVEANGKDCADCVLNEFDSLCNVVFVTLNFGMMGKV